MEIIRDRKVKLIALKRQYKLLKKPFGMPPIADHAHGGKLVTGLEILEEEVYKSLDPNIIESSKDILTINDGQELNLKYDYDLMIYVRCLIYPQIAKSKDGISSDNIFYIHDAEAIAVKEAEKAEVMFEAIDFVRDLSAAEFNNIAIYLGHNTKSMKPTVIKGNVIKTSMSNPSEILTYSKLGKLKEMTLLCHKLIVYGFVHKTQNGYFYNKNFIGNNIEGMIKELLKSENQAILSKLTKEIAIYENPQNRMNPTKEAKKVPTSNDKDLKEIARLKLEGDIKDAKFEFFKAVGTEYEGKDDLELINATMIKHVSAKEYIEKWTGKESSAVIGNLKQRKVSEELFKDVEDPGELIKIGVNHILNK